MADIFISHASVDKPLALFFVNFLKEAIGVPAKSIFCSSLEGHGIPFGVDFNAYLKKSIKQPKLVILLMTKSYMESDFCLMELGATWGQSTEALPIVVPPVAFTTVTKTLGLVQAWKIEQDTGLIELRRLIRKTRIRLERRTEHDWDSKRKDWTTKFPEVLKELSSRDSKEGDLDPSDYALEITEPSKGSNVASSFELKGTLRKMLPDGWELRLLNRAMKSGVMTYWPHGAALDLTPQSEGAVKWAVTYTAREYKDNDRRDLVLYFVGPDGQALLSAYFKLNERFAPKGSAPWEGITDLTRDMKLACKPFHVFLVK